MYLYTVTCVPVDEILLCYHSITGTSSALHLRGTIICRM